MVRFGTGSIKMTQKLPEKVVRGGLLPKETPLVPVAQGTSLDDNPHLDTIYKMLCSGWHPLAVVRAMKKSRSVVVSFEAVVELFQSIPDRDKLPLPELLQGAFPVSPRTDTVADMHRMVVLQQRRVMGLLNQESLDEDDDKLFGRIGYEMQKLWSMTRQLALLEDKVGTSPYRGKETSTEAKETPHIATVREILSRAKGTRSVTLERLRVDVEE